MIYIFLLLSPFLTSLVLQAAAQCEDGDLRLVGNFLLLVGSVEVCSMGKWGRVCSTGWNNPDATVVCRELGFSDQGSLAVFGPGTGTTVVSRVQCSGNEARLRDCNSSNDTCFSTLNTGVQCRHKGEPVLAINRIIYPNNSIIDLESISTTLSIFNSIACVTDQYPCCNAQDAWFPPNNTDTTLQSNFFNGTLLQSVTLHRNGSKYVPNGIFHCQIKDSSNTTHRLYIGIYLQGLGKPIITTFKFDRLKRMFTCTSIGGPTTNILWSKDGNQLNGTGYKQSQLIVDTGSALYENSLTIQSDVDVSGLYTCTVSNSRGDFSAELSVPTCNNGDALLESDSGEISQICYNGRYYHIETQTTASQSDGKSVNNERIALILGALFGISILAIIIIILVFVILLIRHKKRKQQQQTYEVPSDRSHHEELQCMEHEVDNEIYGTEDEGEDEDSDSYSMLANTAYISNNRKTTNTVENDYEPCKTNADARDVVYDVPNSD